MVPVLAYWDIRGLAQPIRLLLAYTGTEYEDRLYVCGEAPNYDKTCWFDIKHSLGFDFPNLPYYTDDTVKLTQSGAIFRYLARQHSLCGTTEEEQWRVDLTESVIEDFRGAFVRLCYGPNFDTQKLLYLKGLPEKLKQLSDFLGSRDYFAGDRITFPDFIVYEMLDQHLLLDEDCLKDFPKLAAFHKRVQEFESIKAYLASDKCIKKRLNNRMANFGSGVE